jgi:ADP-ribose pyrophosphatase YjhB (NUDIX family)
MAETINFCMRCGSPVSLQVPPGDDRPRHVCGACGTVHYQNPKLVAGCLAEWGETVLLCRRAIEPRYGLWTLPAGFMENGETTQEAALREAREEANARVEILSLYSLYDLPHIGQVYCLFRGRLVDLGFRPGAESLEVRLFREEDIPWDTLAFASITHTLRHYFEDRRTGEFPLHTGTIRPAR